jgi:hypothetical protein
LLASEQSFDVATDALQSVVKKLDQKLVDAHIAKQMKPHSIRQ